MMNEWKRNKIVYLLVFRSPPSEDVFASNDVGTVFSTSPADGLSAPAYSVSNHPKYYSDYPPSKQPTNERGQTEDHHTNEYGNFK